MIDFSLEPAIQDLRERTADFVTNKVIPAEPRARGEHGVDPVVRAELQAEAKRAGLFAPHVGRAFGGLGLDHRGQAIVFEEAGYSILGPQALNCAAPDEGNMHMLEKIADEEQLERYLRPLASGEIRSAFAMTEPAPGAGSDPSMLRTEAHRVDGGWSINGRKWFITGADGAGFVICMARTSDRIEHGQGATMFLVDADNPGMRIERVVGAMDRGFGGGHAEMVFDDCRVSDEAVLGEVGKGYTYAQVRLAPARLTHCMRWLGVARRSLDIALDRANEREAFGAKLAENGQIQASIAASVADLETSRLLIWKCAWELDQGQHASQASSLAKSYVAEAVYRVVDRAIQICGSLGVSDDLPLSTFLNEVRPFRIYDGPTETHRWAIARRTLRNRLKATGATTE